MRTVKIVSGVFGHRPEGSKYIEPKKAGDPPFLVADELAARLVAIKVAVYVNEDNISLDTGVATAIKETVDAKAVDNITEDNELLQSEIEPLDDEQPQADNEPPQEVDLPERPAYTADMKAAELREIMDEYQLPFKVGMSKVDMVAALDDFFADEVEDDESADELPEIGAEDPIV